MRTAKNDWSDCVDRAILYDWNAMKTDQMRGSCSLVGLKCYDQTAWIVQSCMTEMLWRLIRLRGSCNLVWLKCYEDWSLRGSCNLVWLKCYEDWSDCMGNLVWLKCYEDWSDCVDRAILYDWNAMKTDQTAWAILYDWNAMKIDQTAWIVQSCRTEMLWRLIRLHGSCNLVWLKCYEDWSDCIGNLVWLKCYEDCVDRAVL